MQTRSGATRLAHESERSWVSHSVSASDAPFVASFLADVKPFVSSRAGSDVARSFGAPVRVRRGTKAKSADEAENAFKTPASANITRVATKVKKPGGATERAADGGEGKMPTEAGGSARSESFYKSLSASELTRHLLDAAISGAQAREDAAAGDEDGDGFSRTLTSRGSQRATIYNALVRLKAYRKQRVFPLRADYARWLLGLAAYLAGSGTAALDLDVMSDAQLTELAGVFDDAMSILRLRRRDEDGASGEYEFAAFGLGIVRMFGATTHPTKTPDVGGASDSFAIGSGPGGNTTPDPSFLGTARDPDDGSAPSNTRGPADRRASAAVAAAKPESKRKRASASVRQTRATMVSAEEEEQEERADSLIRATEKRAAPRRGAPHSSRPNERDDEYSIVVHFSTLAPRSQTKCEEEDKEEEEEVREEEVQEEEEGGRLVITVRRKDSHTLSVNVVTRHAPQDVTRNAHQVRRKGPTRNVSGAPLSMDVPLAQINSSVALSTSETKRLLLDVRDRMRVGADDAAAGELKVEIVVRLTDALLRAVAQAKPLATHYDLRRARLPSSSWSQSLGTRARPYRATQVDLPERASDLLGFDFQKALVRAANL